MSSFPVNEAKTNLVAQKTESILLKALLHTHTDRANGTKEEMKRKKCTHESTLKIFI